MIFIPILNPKIELSAFSRSAEPVKSFKKHIKPNKTKRVPAQGVGRAPRTSLASGLEGIAHPRQNAINTTGSALRENADNSILGFKTGIKTIIFQLLTLLIDYFTMPIVSGT